MKKVNKKLSLNKKAIATLQNVVGGYESPTYSDAFTCANTCVPHSIIITKCIAEAVAAAATAAATAGVQ